MVLPWSEPPRELGLSAYSMSNHMSDREQIKPNSVGYPPESHAFVLDGLAHTVRLVHGDKVAVPADGVPDPSDHVSGEQLCLGLRDYAIRRYGRLAGTVLRRWNISETDDFGRIVFAMVESKKLLCRPEDTPASFRAVFDFAEAFGDLAAPGNFSGQSTSGEHHS